MVVLAPVLRQSPRVVLTPVLRVLRYFTAARTVARLRPTPAFVSSCMAAFPPMPTGNPSRSRSAAHSAVPSGQLRPAVVR